MRHMHPVSLLKPLPLTAVSDGTANKKTEKPTDVTPINIPMPEVK